MSDDPIQRLILELGRLPGVGERSAARLAFYIVKASQPSPSDSASPVAPSLARDLAEALLDVVERVGLCGTCQNFAAGAVCSICSDPRRDQSLLCVVEGVADLRAIERSGGFRGIYHVLHGAIAPLDGVGPRELRLDRLAARVETAELAEVIVATNADVEGDATALYIADLLGDAGVRLTRLASGVPLGGELEYLDQATVGRALSERRELV